jgi:glycerophosphoryl diester phosphodiesterase
MASATTVTVEGRTAEFVCHMGMLSGRYRRNSIEAIRECFEAGAARIEIDIHSLAGADYVVYHDRGFDTETTGSGSPGAATPDDVRALHFKESSESRPPLLSEVVELARGFETELQLDWKDWRLMSGERLLALVDTVAPVRERVIVSTGQDWNLRRLRDADPALPFGFDPGHYIGYDPARYVGQAGQGTAGVLPRRVGAYGYGDDHPMAFVRAGSTADYLAERMAILTLQAPGSREYFLSYRLVLQMLDDGFDVTEWLHARGIGANVWTADYAGPESLEGLRRLVAAGIDRITTNTAPAWIHALATA